MRKHRSEYARQDSKLRVGSDSCAQVALTRVVAKWLRKVACQRETWGEKFSSRRSVWRVPWKSETPPAQASAPCAEGVPRQKGEFPSESDDTRSHLERQAKLLELNDAFREAEERRDHWRRVSLVAKARNASFGIHVYDDGSIRAADRLLLQQVELVKGGAPW